MNSLRNAFGYLILLSSVFITSCTGGMKDIDGNIYSSIKVRNQVWSQQNLKVSRFRNGDSIPEVSSKEEWARYTAEGKPACCTVMNEPQNGVKYGKLYNWFAVNDPRGLAPKGWHIPTDDEWTRITNAYGGSIMAAMNMRVSSDGNGKDDHSKAGFCGLPSGARDGMGEFFGMASYGYWWSSTEAMDTVAWMRVLSYIDCSVNFLHYQKGCGLSVRCVKD